MRTELYVTARILPISTHPTRWGQNTAYSLPAQRLYGLVVALWGHAHLVWPSIRTSREHWRGLRGLFGDFCRPTPPIWAISFSFCCCDFKASKCKNPLFLRGFRATSDNNVIFTGGERGIRTLGTLLTYTRFPGVLLQPLGHLSSKVNVKYSSSEIVCPAFHTMF